MTDCVIVGGGPAGLTAAIYAKRAGLDVTVIESQFPGGQMTTTPDIGNYPGFPSITGPELSEQMASHARGLDIAFQSTKATGFDFTPGALSVQTDKGPLPAKTIILAMGAHRRTLDCPGEELFRGRGVSYCATCDGNFFRNRDVVVVGGGNTALEDALYLCGVARTVTLVHRREEFRAQLSLQNALKSKENLTIRTPFTVAEIIGEKAVTGVTLTDLNTKETSDLPCAAVFIAVGTVPESRLLEGLLRLDETRRVPAPENGTTEIPGVFVAGDLRAKPLYQIVTACSDGAVAAMSAHSFIEELSVSINPL